MKPTILKLLGLGLLLLLVSGCASARQGPQARLSDGLPLAPLSGMPDFVRDADRRTQEAYQFALANPEALDHIPCYCGCNALGHKNNRECYLAPNGKIDQHAAFCGVCVDITQDVMMLTRQGRSPAVMRAFIDGKYSQFGPSTETDPVPGQMREPAGPHAPDHK